LAIGQGELALSLEYDYDTQTLSLEACVLLPKDAQQKDLAAAYFSLCDLDSPSFHNFFFSSTIDNTPDMLLLYEHTCTFQHTQTPLAIYVGKKYKPVAIKVRPVETKLPSRFRITRNIKGEPLKDMPKLSPHPPPYTPTGQYTEERKAIIDRTHPGDFLLPAERDLMHHFMCVQNLSFAWCDLSRAQTLPRRLLPPYRNPNHTAQALDAEEHPDPVGHL
jgi:hypothetical protein